MSNPVDSRALNDDEINLLELWTILRDGWLIVAVCVALGVALAFVASQVMTPIYRAETTIAQVKRGGNDAGASSLLNQFGGLAGLAGGRLRGLGSGGSDGLTILRSRTFIETFVDERSLLPEIYADLWDENTRSWSSEIERPPQLWQGANRFIEDAYRFEEDKDTGLFKLAIEWPDAERAAEWANRLVALANETARARDIADAQTSIAYLNEQIEQTDVVELQRVLYNLLEAEQKTLMLANAHEDYVFKVVDPAVVPVSPSRPNTLFLLILGVVAGGFAGVVIVFLRLVARGVRDQEKAARGTSGQGTL